MSRDASKTLRVRALAKINLSLRLLGLRPDGYHELRTTLQSLALHDTLTLAPARGPLTLTSDDPGCPTDESNLVWRAAERLWRADGRKGKPAGVSIDIRKRIPMQAGLGGGSSDGASALRGLAAFWRTRVTAASLHEIARTLGADVAFFVLGGTALGVGRGDVLYPLADHPPASVVIVRPGFGVSTEDAYGWWDAADAGAGPAGKALARQSMLGRLPESGNDLEAPVAAKHPEIERIVRRLLQRGAAHAAMSGSGSAVFGLFRAEPEALDAAAAAAAPGRVVTVTRTVNRREYARLAAPG